MKPPPLVILALVLAAQSSAVTAEHLIPAGYLIQCTISQPKLSSKTAIPGEPVLCQLGYPERYGRLSMLYNGFLVGRFEDYKDPGHFVGKGWMELIFDRMVIEPDTVVPVHAKVVDVPGYNVDRNGRILGKGHAVRDAVEWSIPILWPIDALNLPRRGPRPVLKSETRLTLKVMDDVGVPDAEPIDREPSGLIRRQPSSYTPRIDGPVPLIHSRLAAPSAIGRDPQSPTISTLSNGTPRRVRYVSPKSAGPVTLVFKDGRVPEQIQNYVLTPTKLYVFDGYSHIISLDELDVNATQQVNRASEIDFRVPERTGQ